MFAKKSDKCKTALRMSKPELKIMRNRKEQEAAKERAAVADHLRRGEDTAALFKAGHLFRTENMIGAYELLEMYCDFILRGIDIIQSQRKCPDQLKESAATIIYAAPRCSDVGSLRSVGDYLAGKLGKEFAAAAHEALPDSGVERLIVEKLSQREPDTATKLRILSKIAHDNDVSWEPRGFDDNSGQWMPTPASTGYASSAPPTPQNSEAYTPARGAASPAARGAYTHAAEAALAAAHYGEMASLAALAAAKLAGQQGRGGDSDEDSKGGDVQDGEASSSALPDSEEDEELEEGSELELKFAALKRNLYSSDAAAAAVSATAQVPARQADMEEGMRAAETERGRGNSGDDDANWMKRPIIGGFRRGGRIVPPFTQLGEEDDPDRRRSH